VTVTKIVLLKSILKSRFYTKNHSQFSLRLVKVENEIKRAVTLEILLSAAEEQNF
jgi:hypothetical protein